MKLAAQLLMRSGQRLGFGYRLTQKTESILSYYSVQLRNTQSAHYRWISDASPSTKSNENWDEKENAEFERQSKKQEDRYRLLKKVFSTFLFGSTLGIVYLARRRKQAELSENLRDCVLLPIDENYHGGHQEFYRVPSKRTGKPTYVLPGQMVKYGSLRLIQDFKVRQSDVFVASFPKAGITWVQEIVYLIKHDLNFQKASEKVLESRFPYLEYLYPGIHSVVNMSSPRLMKTHLPFDLLPPDITSTAKLIYVKRNPKDTVVSYFHFARMLAMSSYRGTFAEFLNKFQRDQVPYGPYFEHVESYMENQDEPNILILSYEDLSRDPGEVVRKIGIFLERPLSEDEVQAIVRHTTFDSMAHNPSVNYSHWDEIGIRNKGEALFLRKGQVGDWRNYFTKETNTEFEAWIQQRNKSERPFEYDLPEVIP